jgi:cation transporter-like permease
VVAFVIFHGVGVALDLLDCANERPPGRTRFLIMMPDLWHIAVFRDVAGCFSRRLRGRVAGLLVFRVFGPRQGIANATMAMVLTRTGRIFLFAFCIMSLLASVRVNFNPDPSARHVP